MSNMKIIKPTVITDAMLSSSTAAEPGAGETAWNAATAYSVGDVAIRATTHMKYERLVAGTTAMTPEDDPINWLPTTPTNRWSVFDRKIGTLTTLASPLTFVLEPGQISGVAMLELTGREAVVSLKDAPGGTEVYSHTVTLDGTVVTSFYEWFYSEFEQLTDFVLTDLPEHYALGELTISLTGTSSVSAGVLQVGQVLTVGGTQYGASVGIIDYGVKDVDDFGNIDVLERTFRKTSSLKIMTEKADFNKIYRRLAALRSIPCVYIGVDEIGYEPMINYGFYKSFSIVVQYEMKHLCNLEIEGLTV